MTELTYPDISAFQAGLSLKGARFVVARASEGNWLKDSAYAGFKAQAARDGTPFCGYHFLEGGSSAESQARFCHSIVGFTPLMLDFEPIMARASDALTVDDPGGMGQYCGSSWAALQEWHLAGHPSAQPGDELVWLNPEVAAGAPFISKPGIDKALAFIDHYRALGGVCHLLYYPHWFWQMEGSQSLKRFADRRMALVSSNYTDLSTGAGWQPYGGMTPQVWQFADDHLFNGHRIDWNATKHTPAQLHALAATGSVNAADNPVKGLCTAIRYTQVDVSWAPAEHARKYLVKAWVADTRQVVHDLQTTRTKVTLRNLHKGTRYRISVWAEPGTGETAHADVTTRG